MRDIRLPTEEESRIQWWRRVVVRRESTPIPLAEFCRQLGITTRKFYYWRQRLVEIDAERSSSHHSSRILCILPVTPHAFRAASHHRVRVLARLL